MIFDFLIIGLVFGGIMAIGNMLISRGPNGRQATANLLPLRVALGVLLVFVGALNLLRNLEHLSSNMSSRPLASIILYGSIATAVVMGGFFAVSMLSRWVPANSPAEQKVNELTEKLTPAQAMLGFVALGLAGLLLLQRTGTWVLNT